MDVGGWLRGLGLGQYEEKFRDNKIDADVLPRLTVDDLKDIGVASWGHRKKLLEAIADLGCELINSPGKPDAECLFCPESDKSLRSSEMS